jgi:hypothetical protein
MPASAEKIDISCATEVFLAIALLHHDHPKREDFSISEIVSRAARESMTPELRSGVNVHASQHCVANRPPNPAKHKMLFATGKHTRRLLKAGDEVHEGRTGKIFPAEDEVPEKYLPLLAWAKKRYEKSGGASGPAITKASSAHAQTQQVWLESLFELEGLGKEYWKDVDPDEFVRKLREGWE